VPARRSRTRKTVALAAPAITGVAATTGSVRRVLGDDAAACDEWVGACRSATRIATSRVWVGARCRGGAQRGRRGFHPSSIGLSGARISECRTHRRGPAISSAATCRTAETCLDALGGFRLGYGCDETEFCIRLHQRWPERRILYVPDATVDHNVPPSRTTFRRFMSRAISRAAPSSRDASRRTDPRTVIAVSVHPRRASTRSVARSHGARSSRAGQRARARGRDRGRVSSVPAWCYVDRGAGTRSRGARRGWSGAPIRSSRSTPTA
jgi:hypothetical protein